MKKIIRKILKEDQRERYLDKIADFMKNDYPLFHNLKLYGFYDQLLTREITYILSGIFGEPVRINQYGIYDKNNNEIYWENSDGKWNKREYDENGNLIYKEDSDDHWEKWEHDERNNEIYYETSNGFWIKRKYDENGNEIYYEDSDGYIEDYR